MGSPPFVMPLSLPNSLSCTTWVGTCILSPCTSMDMSGSDAHLSCIDVSSPYAHLSSSFTGAMTSSLLGSIVGVPLP